MVTHMDGAAGALKAVILAAGAEASCPDGGPLLLEKLGGRCVIEYVVDLALKHVAREDLYVVVGRWGAEVKAALGSGYHYVAQDTPSGTGDAVLQLRPRLAGFAGDLLILYGDTPLFRPASIRGLLNRHRLCEAELTLLTAVLDHPLPYGRIIRDVSGQIVDIIEEADASAKVRMIHELNLGAYIVRAPVLFPALARLARASDAELRLPDCVHLLIRSGGRVGSYRTYDQDEAQGINCASDLSQAEFILQKRLYRPRRSEEENEVAFGTGGWRAMIGEGFTLYNIRRLSQALANAMTTRGEEEHGVLIGYDRRFLGREAAEASAEVFAGNNIPVTLLPEAAPTPLVTYATAAEKAQYGLAITASHNPPEWNGVKVFRADGALLLDDETRAIEVETNRLQARDLITLELDLALAAGVVRRIDYTNQYVDAVEKQIDLAKIREAGLKVIVDPMYGVGQLTLGTILTEARCRVTFIHERHDPLFGGRSPAPNLEALRLLRTHVVEGGYDLGLATDGDADRIAMIDERGEYVSTNEILLLVYWYLHEGRRQRGGVVRNMATTHLLDRLAEHLGEKHYEAPVGFKHIIAGMTEHRALLGGESSGGLTIRGHILGKDGILACALVVEMLAHTGKKVSQLLTEVYATTGRLYSGEESLPATPDMRAAVPRRLAEANPAEIAGLPVVSVSHADGIKFYLPGDQWALLRFSGTEPLVRMFVEAATPEQAQALLDWLRHFVAQD